MAKAQSFTNQLDKLLNIQYVCKDQREKTRLEKRIAKLHKRLEKLK